MLWWLDDKNWKKNYAKDKIMLKIKEKGLGLSMTSLSYQTIPDATCFWTLWIILGFMSLLAGVSITCSQKYFQLLQHVTLRKKTKAEELSPFEVLAECCCLGCSCKAVCNTAMAEKTDWIPQCMCEVLVILMFHAPGEMGTQNAVALLGVTGTLAEWK